LALGSLVFFASLYFFEENLGGYQFFTREDGALLLDLRNIEQKGNHICLGSWNSAAITGDSDGPFGKLPARRNDNLSLTKIEEWSPSFIIAYVVEGFPSSDERWIYRDQKIHLPREPQSSRIDTAYGDDPPEGFRHCSERALAIAECVAVTRPRRSADCQFFFRR
jgi:hypothetical protein